MSALRRASWVSALLVLATVVQPATVAAAHPPDSGATYRWVSPPTSRKGDNIRPEGRRATIPSGSPFQEFWTPDLQLTLFWPRGALGEAEVTLAATPIDPARLGALPHGFETNGNAYRLELSPTGRFGQPATVTLRIPTAGSAVFQSSDGHAWRKLRAGPPEVGRAVAMLEADGYVVAAAHHGEHQHLAASRRPTVAVLVGGIASIVLAGALLRRRRSKVASTEPSDSFPTNR